MGELQSALDALAAEDLTSMFGPQLLERLGPLLVAAEPDRGRDRPHGAGV